MAERSVDEQGLWLPDPGWPRERAAPGDLELVRRFCNSLNRPNGADRFATPRGFRQWLRNEGRRPIRVNGDDLRRIVAFRDALRVITASNNTERSLAASWSALAHLLEDVTFRLDAGRDALDLVATSPSPTAVFLGDLALICRRAHDDGTLRRLKSCIECEWTIYDASKNMSGRWCSMSVCGGRHNARAYRQRKRR